MAIAGWQAASAGVLISGGLADLALLVPAGAVADGLAAMLDACAATIASVYRSPAQLVAASAGVLLSGGVVLWLGWVAACSSRRDQRERRRPLAAIVPDARLEPSLDVVVLKAGSPGVLLWAVVRVRRPPGELMRSSVRPIRSACRTRRWALPGAAAVTALVLAGCGTDPAVGGEGEDHAAGGEVTLEHVHGLGVDPADDALYAGTHHGLVRISPDGQLTRIADRVQDFMGFTVVGPEHYLASGHPGAGQDAPGNLGLIESTDGGQTWKTLSLAGEADFHALDAADGTIYGYSGGRLLVSEDGVEWADRGPMRIAGLAVDPADPRRVLATTEGGLVVSEDAGTSFTAVADAPLLVLVDIAADGGSAIGVDPDGTVFSSTDGGRTWTERGSVGGAPAALTVDARDVYVAVDGAILASTDGGAAFSDLYREH